MGTDVLVLCTGVVWWSIYLCLIVIILLVVLWQPCTTGGKTYLVSPCVVLWVQTRDCHFATCFGWRTEAPHFYCMMTVHTIWPNVYYFYYSNTKILFQYIAYRIHSCPTSASLESWSNGVARPLAHWCGSDSLHWYPREWCEGCDIACCPCTGWSGLGNPRLLTLY